MMRVDKYREELLLALRLHDISGRHLGEVLAEVESHVEETGEDPVEAFGEPREYAEQVAAQLDPSTGKPSVPRQFAGAAAGGLMALLGGKILVRGLWPNEDVSLTVADAVSAPVALALGSTAVFVLVRATGLTPRRPSTARS